MAWIGSIADRELARKSAGAVLMGQNVLSVTASSLSSVAVAQAAAATQAATLSICDRGWLIPQIQRGYQIASNMGGTFASSYATLNASLPETYNHQRNMIQM